MAKAVTFSKHDIPFPDIIYSHTRLLDILWHRNHFKRTSSSKAKRNSSYRIKPTQPLLSTFSRTGIWRFLSRLSGLGWPVPLRIFRGRISYADTRSCIERHFLRKGSRGLVDNIFQYFGTDCTQHGTARTTKASRQSKKFYGQCLHNSNHIPTSK